VAQKSIETGRRKPEGSKEERYKYQVFKQQTDVLNAVTFLAQARLNYYGAPVRFTISPKGLAGNGAMGRMLSIEKFQKGKRSNFQNFQNRGFLFSSLWKKRRQEGRAVVVR